VNLNDLFLQVDVPLEVVHLTDEYWKNVVCIVPLSVSSLKFLMLANYICLTYNCLMFHCVYQFNIIITLLVSLLHCLHSCLETRGGHEGLNLSI
jgi:hypothetical protein